MSPGRQGLLEGGVACVMEHILCKLSTVNAFFVWFMDERNTQQLWSCRDVN